MSAAHSSSIKYVPICIRRLCFDCFIFFSYYPFPNLILSFLRAFLSQTIHYVGLNLIKAKVRSALVTGSLPKLYPQGSLTLQAVRISCRKPQVKVSFLHHPFLTHTTVVCQAQSGGILQTHPHRAADTSSPTFSMLSFYRISVSQKVWRELKVSDFIFEEYDCHG